MKFRPPKSTSPPATAPKKNSIPPVRPTSCLKTSACTSGLASESLVEALLNADPEIDRCHGSLPQSESERNLLAAVLLKMMKNYTTDVWKELSAPCDESTLAASLNRSRRNCKIRELAAERMQDLLQEKIRLKRALMDPRSESDLPPTGTQLETETKSCRRSSNLLTGRDISAAAGSENRAFT